MVPIRLFDTVSIVPTPSGGRGPGEIRFHCRGVDLAGGGHTSFQEVPRGRENLVVRALELLRQRSGCQRGAIVELVKRIPSAAGLGGGSSDAAAALELANRAWDIGYSPSRLVELAGELGSDVPFFLLHRAAICRGRGEAVEPLPGIVPIHVVVLKPPAGLATSAVYRQLDEMPPRDRAEPVAERQPRVRALAGALQAGHLAEVGRWMGNRLQAAAEELAPWLARIRWAFAELDFLGNQLSGSGTAYFGICRHAQHAHRLASILRKRQLGLVYVARSCC